MSFLNPLFFLGLLALAVPILVHLVRKDKSQIVRFSSLMFLQRIPRKTVRQQKLRNLLLMALRLLLLALLVAAFARPYLVQSTASVVVDQDSRGLVLLLDHSYSMGYGTNFERMKSEALSRLDGLDAGDRAAVIAFSSAGAVLAAPSSNPEELRAAVNALELSSGGTSYYEAFTLADRVLGQMEGSRRELVVISDFQRNGWNRPARESVIDADVAVATVDLGVENPDNTGIDSVAVDATVFTRTYTGQMMARINNHRLADPATVTVSVEINDRQVQQRQVTVPAASSTLVEFTDFELPLGFSRGRVRVDTPDALMADNEFLFVTERRDRLNLLIVDDGRPRQSFFLTEAFAAAPDLPFTVSTVTAANLTPARLDAAEVVILNDVARLSDAVRARLDERRAAGQGQLVFLGDSADLNWWNALEALPVQLQDRVFVQRDRDRPYFSLTTYDRNHEIFTTLEQSSRLTLNTAQFSAYVDVRPKEGAAVVARLEDGSALIVEATADAGGLMVVASSADNRWNDLPLKPSFLPLLHEMVRHLAHYREDAPWHQLGEAVPVPVSNQPVALIDPSGVRESLGDTVESGRFFTPGEAGFYELRIGPDIRYVAVNAPSSESLLQKMPPEDLLASVMRLEGEARRSALLADAAPDDYARRQSWWWYLFLLALLAGIGEVYLGNRVTEDRPGTPASGASA